MDNIIKQLKNGAKHTRLSFSEKEEMKNVLLQHVRNNSATVSIFQRKSIPSPFSIQSFRDKKSISILVIGSLLMGGSVSFAAENTVPGDILFLIKMNVNESVRGTFAVTQKAKAEWEVRLVERRLVEVEKLSAKTNVSPETKALAEKNFSEYSDRVKDRIAKFERGDASDDAIETAEKFSEMLRKHEDAIDDLDMYNEIALIEKEIKDRTATIDKGVSDDEEIPSFKEVREKVREARDSAEKKHKELKEKYRKEAISVKDMVPREEESRRPIRENNQKEEIRSSNNKQIELNKTIEESSPILGEAEENRF